MVTTHSPFFLNGLRPEEVWVLYRDRPGIHGSGKRAADMRGSQVYRRREASWGILSVEGFFEVGDPLTAEGGTKTRTLQHGTAGRHGGADRHAHRVPAGGGVGGGGDPTAAAQDRR